MNEGRLTIAQFRALMQTVADGWNEGNARKAADCFAEDADYTEPPDTQVYHGRAALYEFFGGEQGTDVPMHMTFADPAALPSIGNAVGRAYLPTVTIGQGFKLVRTILGR